MGTARHSAAPRFSWDDGRDQVLRDNWRDAGVEQLAALIGCSRRCLYDRAAALGLPPRDPVKRAMAAGQAPRDPLALPAIGELRARVSAALGIEEAFA